MTDISVFGLQVRIIASNTFPAGFTVTSFSDDTDPLGVENTEVGDAVVTVGGAIASYAKTGLIMPKISVVSFSEEDNNMQILLAANRPTIGKVLAKDIITATFVYPNGRVYTAIKGLITGGPLLFGGKSEGKLNTHVYEFKFENVTAG